MSSLQWLGSQPPYLSSVTDTPKDWVPLFPIDIPQRQAQDNLFSCPAHLPTGWGKSKNKCIMIQIRNLSLLSPSCQIERLMQGVGEKPIFYIPRPAPISVIIFNGDQSIWCEYLFLQSNAFPTCHIHLLAHPFIQQLLYAKLILSIEDAVVNKIQKSSCYYILELCCPVMHSIATWGYLNLK